MPHLLWPSRFRAAFSPPGALIEIDISVDEDTCTWVLSNDDTFSVKSARRLIDSKLLPSISTLTVWDKFLPRKVNIFLWVLSLDLLPHRLNLSSHGLDIPTISCSSCNGNVESADHVFFENHREEEDEEENNSPETETLTYHVLATYGKGYKLRPSYYAIKKTFKMIGLGYDCCLFWGDDNKDLDFCPVCNTSRWKDSNTSRKKVPKKVLHYFSIMLRDKQTVMPLGYHAAHWCSYIGRSFGTQFDLRSHMESPDWTEINAGIQQHLQKAYNTNKATFKAQHWDKYIEFWNDPRNIARAAQNQQNQAKSTVISRQGSRSLARLRDEMRQSSTTQEYPSLIDTFFVAHTVNGEFLRDEERRIYEEMRRLEATDTYTDDEINRLARGGKLRGNIPGVGRVFPARTTASPSTPAHESTLDSLHKKVDFMMSLFKSDSKYSDMFSQFESGGASGSGGCGDEEEGATIRTTRMRMAMSILSCVIYGLVCYIFILCSSWRPEFPWRHVAGEYVPPWHLFLDWKICGTHRLAGDCHWGRNPLRAFPANIPGRLVAGESYPH
nr:reverse transcriptase zinc-binding domain-containing protein [Tanacetum cinerariifolium]